MASKRCPKCGETKEHTEENFYFFKSQGKLDYYCRICRSNKANYKDKPRINEDQEECFGNPVNELSVRVIDMALTDLVIDKMGNRPDIIAHQLNDRMSAIKFFFSPSSNLPTFCDILGWRIETVREFAREVLAGKRIYYGFNFAPTKFIRSA